MRPENGRSSGRSCPQTSVANGQRRWKAQPGGGSIGEGSSPFTVRRLERALGSTDGVAASSAWV